MCTSVISKPAYHNERVKQHKLQFIMFNAYNIILCIIRKIRVRQAYHLFSYVGKRTRMILKSSCVFFSFFFTFFSFFHFFFPFFPLFPSSSLHVTLRSPLLSHLASNDLHSAHCLPSFNDSRNSGMIRI